VAAKERHDREAARTRIFDSAQTLADALVDGDGAERWEPSRDLILARARSRRPVPRPRQRCLTTASGELAAAALDTHRHAGRNTR
jgi:hypothetical protein